MKPNLKIFERWPLAALVLGSEFQFIHAGIQFKAQQKDDGIQPNKQHQDQQRSNRTIEFVVLGKPGYINAKSIKGRNCQKGCQHSTCRKERNLLAFFGSKVVKQGDGGQNHKNKKYVADIFQPQKLITPPAF